MAAPSKNKQVFDTGKDRDVITARSGAKAMGHKCGNPECYVRAIEVPLKACAKCKTIRSVAVTSMKFTENEPWDTGIVPVNVRRPIGRYVTSNFISLTMTTHFAYSSES